MENRFKDAPDPTVGVKFKVKVTAVKGICRANHMVGQEFELDAYDPGGLCGFFYHNLFPYLVGFQYGAEFPWWGDQKAIEIDCPDPYNKLTLILER